MKLSHQLLWASFSVYSDGINARGTQVHGGNLIYNLSGEFFGKTYY